MSRQAAVRFRGAPFGPSSGASITPNRFGTRRLHRQMAGSSQDRTVGPSRDNPVYLRAAEVADATAPLEG